jgi:hypothetical protein
MVAVSFALASAYVDAAYPELRVVLKIHAVAVATIGLF